MIRIYQIIDKWDQLFTIKNASTFLNLGIDGEKHLQFNLKQQDIWRLREKNELNRAAKKGV
jgi:archaeosine-15-forming tRNA-guanine transglycosylase